MENPLKLMVPVTPRKVFALIAVACGLLLAFGFYLQYFQDQDPCPLCLVQRGFYLAVMVVCAAAAAHGPRAVGAAVYSSIGFLFAAGGAAVAGRHVWLQHLPSDKVPACGPDLYFMLENLPFMRTLEKLFKGSGQCAEVKWTFLSLSIAEWSLVCFVLLSLLTAWNALKSARVPH